MTQEALKTELADLQRKLAKRQDEAGYAQNVADIKARIAEIEGELSGDIEADPVGETTNAPEPEAPEEPEVIEPEPEGEVIGDIEDGEG